MSSNTRLHLTGNNRFLVSSSVCGPASEPHRCAYEQNKKCGCLFALSFLVEYAQIHGPGMQINAAVKFVLLGVKSHLRPPVKRIWVPESYLIRV
jgi:hypothetical protein